MALTTTSSHTLYHPPDVQQAVLAWDASCGPAALAAILRKPLAQVRPLMPEFQGRGYCNPTHMLAALARAFCQVPKQHRGAGQPWPTYGLGFVQWHGPWLAPGVPVGAAYRHTHWIGIVDAPPMGTLVYDINAWDTHRQQYGDWLPLKWWEKELVPAITAEVPRATGDWHIRWSCQVILPRPKRGEDSYAHP